MNKLKILFTIPNFDTAGSGKALLNIAKGINSNLFEVEILCKHDKGPFFEIVKASGIPIHIYEYENSMRPLFKGLWNCWKTSRLFKKIHPDVIHSFHYSSDYSEPFAARLAGIKWVYTKKNMNWGGYSKNSWKLRTYFAAAIAVQNTDMISNFFSNHLKKCHLIPRGVDTNEFDPSILPDVIVRKNNEKWIVCVANLVPIKGIEVLIDAFINASSNYEGIWRLIIVGDCNNEYGQNLLKDVNQKNLQDKIYFTGKVLNVKSYLFETDIFVLPTLHKGRMEGSPVSLLEAMSMAKPVLGSKIPGIRDQLSEFENYLFDPGNSNLLAKKLIELMSLSDEERLNIGAKLREHVLNYYSIQLEIQRHEKLYQSIC